MKPYRLAIVAPHPVQYHVPLYKAMSRSKNLDVTVLYLHKTGYDDMLDTSGKARSIVWKQDFLSGYEYIFFKNIEFFRSPGGVLSRINPGIIGHLFSKRYDVVFIQGYVPMSMWFALVAAKLSGAKVIWRGEVVNRSCGDQPSWGKWLKNKIARFHIGHAAAVMYTCSGNHDFLKTIGIKEEKLYSFPCAVDNELMRQYRNEFLPLSEQTKSELDIPQDHFVITVCGRLAQRKRPFDLLEAVKRVNDPKITVMFVGDGSMRQDLENFAASEGISVRFSGFVDQTQLGRYYTIADIFVILSEYDPSPKALNEAMNFSLPVIATKVIGTAYDLVIEGQNGFLVDVGDVNAIADRIELLSKDPDLRARMGRRSAEIVRPFNFEADVAGIINACNDVFGKNKGKTQ